MNRVLLVSGGIDSTIMMYQAKINNIECELLYVRCGEVYEEEELLCLRELISKYNISYRLNVINISGITRYDRFVPNRNLTIASIAVTSLGADEIWIAGLKDDNVVDKNEHAYRLMSSVLSEFSEMPVRVISPYSHISKGDLIGKFMLEVGDEELVENILRDTYSCYSEERGHCGNCPACFRKFVALKSNGISPGFVISKAIAVEYLKKLHIYPPDRINRSLIALRSVFGGIICYDLDGVICGIDKGVPYEKKMVRYRPNIVEGLVLIYTSRMESDREVTEKWLEDNGIQYHSLLMDKPNYDIIYDDKARDENFT